MMVLLLCAALTHQLPGAAKAPDNHIFAKPKIVVCGVRQTSCSDHVLNATATVLPRRPQARERIAFHIACHLRVIAASGRGRCQ